MNDKLHSSSTKPVAPDPSRLDANAFCRNSQALEGCLALTELPRLHAAVQVQPDGWPDAGFAWSAAGRFQHPTGRDAQWRVHLQAKGEVHLVCQRCLEAVQHRLTVETTLRFVPSEQQAEALDESSDDEDVLALPKRLNLHELIEDELILALPLVPRHEECPVPVQAWIASAQSLPPDNLPDGGMAEHAPEKPHPFAALAALKARPKGH